MARVVPGLLQLSWLPQFAAATLRLRQAIASGDVVVLQEAEAAGRAAVNAVHVDIAATVMLTVPPAEHPAKLADIASLLQGAMADWAAALRELQERVLMLTLAEADEDGEAVDPAVREQVLREMAADDDDGGDEQLRRDVAAMETFVRAAAAAERPGGGEAPLDAAAFEIVDAYLREDS